VVVVPVSERPWRYAGGLARVVLVLVTTFVVVGGCCC
jgi:hypothetical protein